MNSLIFFSLSLCIFLIFPRQTLQINTQSSEVVEIVAQNITSNLAEWENDFALVFYAPWCQYCKQMLNVWESVAKATKNRRNLVIGKFNCEGNSLQTDICQEFGVDRYPSIFFIGYSKFYQAPTSNPLGKSKYPRVVKYTADLYPEAIYDWLLFLHSVGSISRKWNNIWGRLFGKSSDSKRIRELRSMNDALVKKVELFSAELQKYKAIELFDSLDDYGDPFPILHEETPEDVRYSFSISYLVILFCRAIILSENVLWRWQESTASKWSEFILENFSII